MANSMKGAGAFKNCENWTTVTMPPHKILYCDGSVFAGCKKLSSKAKKMLRDTSYTGGFWCCRMRRLFEYCFTGRGSTANLFKGGRIAGTFSTTPMFYTGVVDWVIALLLIKERRKGIVLCTVIILSRTGFCNAPIRTDCRLPLSAVT